MAAADPHRILIPRKPAPAGRACPPEIETSVTPSDGLIQTEGIDHDPAIQPRGPSESWDAFYDRVRIAEGLQCPQCGNDGYYRDSPGEPGPIRSVGSSLENAAYRCDPCGHTWPALGYLAPPPA
jgi:hypothetical protein